MNVQTRIQDRHLYTACPLCDGTDFAHLRSDDCTSHPLYNAALSPQINWQSCADCGHIFTDGHFTDAATAIVFDKVHEHQVVGANLEENRPISAQIVDRVLPFHTSGRWMDIGFGNGSLLFVAQEYGFHPVGVDLRSDNVALMRQFGVEAYCEDIQTLTLETPCHVISLMDVLEHVPYPKPFLRAVVGHLADGGVVLLSMPNTEQILWDALTRHNMNPYWKELEHYHNFSRTRLYALLEEVGLTPEQYGVSKRYKTSMEVIARKTG